MRRKKNCSSPSITLAMWFCFVVDWPTLFPPLAVGLWLLNGLQLQGEVSQIHSDTHSGRYTCRLSQTNNLRLTHSCESTHTLWQTSALTEPFPIILIYICLCLYSHILLCCFYVTTHICVCVWLFVYFCTVSVFGLCGACMCLWCVYISPHHLPSLLQHTPPPVLSVPAGSKGGLSSASLQRSRSDVDVNAAAVAKYRHVGQTRATGRLPPGSYSSLGKGPVSQVRWLIRQCRH